MHFENVVLGYFIQDNVNNKAFVINLFVLLVKFHIHRCKFSNRNPCFTVFYNSLDGNRGPRAPPGFFYATWFFFILKVSIFRICQVPSWNNVPKASFLTSGGPLSALTCCVNARLLSAIKKISPLIYSQSWVGSWVYTMHYDDFHPDIVARMYT